MSWLPLGTYIARERRRGQSRHVRSRRYRNILHAEERRWYLMVTLVIALPVMLAVAVMYFQYALPAWG